MKYLLKLLLLLSLSLVLLLTGCGEKKPQIENLDAELQLLIETHQIPALAAVVISDGKIVAEGAVGVRKYGDSTPVTIDDQFYLGSCGKAFTATLIAVLVEQGKLDWKTTLAEYYPELADQMLPRYRDVTLVHLLSHHAGLSGNTMNTSIPPGTSDEYWWDSTDPITQQRNEFTKDFLCQPPGPEVDELPEPGTTFFYSNVGYVIAGAIAEHVTGESWEELVTTHIFQPLGMTTAGFGPMGTSNKVDQPWQHLDHITSSLLPEVMQHLSTGDKITPIAPDTPHNDGPPVHRPCGLIHMSLRDWAKFVIMHMEGEDGKSYLLKPETFKFLHTPPFSRNYALGWIVENTIMTGDTVIYTHTGSNYLNEAYVGMSLEYNFAIIMATNILSSGSGSAISEVTLTQFYDRFPEK